ncbi:hypothetical protein WJX73_005895 [Symbiochloris irregularis]|uniref:Protein kinase domain-containing protein n=1 Tax=Symbiochloris irregularis TaxID=706552 RepID=A0AAW1P069_9CHLO
MVALGPSADQSFHPPSHEARQKQQSLTCPSPSRKYRAKREHQRRLIVTRALDQNLLQQIDSLSSQPPHFGTNGAKSLLSQASKAFENAEIQKLRQGGLAQQLSSATASAQQALQDAAHGIQDIASPPAGIPGGISDALGIPAAHATALALGSSRDTVQQATSSALSAPVPALLGSWLDSTATSLQTYLRGVGAGYSPVTIAALLSAVALVVYVTAPATDEVASGGSSVPEDILASEYDADFVAAYWARRPGAVSVRSVQVLGAALRVGSGLFLDAARGRWESNSPLRANQLRGELERLGPAYVKVAQAVSTRVDILPPAYLLEMERLQDRVPPFSSTEAYKVIERCVGQSVRKAFVRISPAPVASASLGQVYRATLSEVLGGQEVAVKVQRPHVLAQVALDLFLMRWVALASQKLPQVSTDWVGLIDEWALRFFQELDYRREAVNSEIFAAQMEHLEGITVSRPFPRLTTRDVLTTAWVQGEKLSESDAGDVRALCNTLLNCYLIQLLETGFLHADPHPGNLLRTPDGRICILDFGMMTSISPARSIALVEYIAHLSIGDWTSVAQDLTALGFTKPGQPGLVEAGVVGPLGRILEELSRGGGAKGINIDQVTAELDGLTRRYPFQVPSYFALILRCFSVIEGIALRVDPQYSIVQECFPYLARRLLTDDHPRTRAALRQLLYGDKTRLDVQRLKRLTTGLGNFTVSGLTTNGSSQSGVQLNSTTKEALRMVFNSRGSYVQEVIVEETVAAIDALGREVLSEVCARVLGAPVTAAAFAGLRAMGPLRPFLLPLPTPVELLSRLQPAVAMTQEDEEALDVARSLFSLFGATRQPGQPQIDFEGAQRFASQLAPMLPELLPGFAYTGELFIRALIRRIALRVADEARPRPQPSQQQPGLPVARC